MYSINAEISTGFSHSSIFIGVFLASVIYSLNEICIRYSIHLTSFLQCSDIISFKISLSHLFFASLSLPFAQTENMFLSLSSSLINLVYCERFYSRNWLHYLPALEPSLLPSFDVLPGRKTNSRMKRLYRIIQISVKVSLVGLLTKHEILSSV